MKKDRPFFFFVFAVTVLILATVIARDANWLGFDFGELVDMIASKLISGEFNGDV